MNKLEQHLDILEDLQFNSHEINVEEAATLDAAYDALDFVYRLNEALREGGANLPEEPDVEKLGTIIDDICGELSAASLFLAEKSFARVPEMLRNIAKAIEKKDVAITDDDGITAPSVPKPVVKGFNGLANRIENARKQQQEILNEMQKNS